MAPPQTRAQHVAISASLAYEALRLVWFPWQRERRREREQERIRIARSCNRTLAWGLYHSLAIRPDGSIACWGDNDNGEAPTPEDDDYATLSANFPLMTDVHIL